MAKDKSLYKEVRTRGARKVTAAKFSEALASRDGGVRPKKVKKTAKDLRAAASVVEEHMRIDDAGVRRRARPQDS